MYEKGRRAISCDALSRKSLTDVKAMLVVKGVADAIKVGFELPQVHELDKPHYLFDSCRIKILLTDGTLEPPMTGIMDRIE